MALDADTISRSFAERGLRLTRQRRAVVDAVAEAGASLSALQVFDAAREHCPELGLTTVYRTLDVLSEIGAVRRVHGPDHCEAFVPAGAAHGHTVVCSSCGRATEFTSATCTRSSRPPPARPATRSRSTSCSSAASAPPATPPRAARRAHPGRAPGEKAGARGRDPAAALLLGSLAAGCGAARSSSGGGRLDVVAVETFLADIAQNVAGDRFAVKPLLPPGADPHAYEPTPRDVAGVASADLLIVNGGGLEGTLLTTLQNAGGGAKIVDVSAGLPSRSPQPGEPRLAAGQADPHFWLDPMLVKTYVANIRDAFIKADPPGRAAYTANAAAYNARLTALDAWIKARVAQIPPRDRRLVTNHASAGYFANRYGFQIVGTVIPGVQHRRDADGAGPRGAHGRHPCERGQGDLRGEGREPAAGAAGRSRGSHQGRHRNLDTR